MVFSNFIHYIKLLFAKDKEFYVFIYSTTGFFPRNIEPYRLAFIHRSKPIKTSTGKWADNERLEFLGDAILDSVVASFLFSHYPDQNEGFLTATRAKIVQRESLNRIGSLLKLDTHVKAAAHTSSHNSYINGNAVEALIGALYLDRGYDACVKFITNRIITRYIDINTLVQTEQNFKSRLIEWTQKYRISIEFELVDTYYDSQNNPEFKTAILLGGIFAADALGYSKKESHQAASKKALDRIKTDPRFREQVLSTAEITDNTEK